MKKLFQLLSLIYFFLSAHSIIAQSSTASYAMPIYKQVQIHYDDDEALHTLLATGLDAITVKNHQLETILSEYDLQQLVDQGFQYHVVIEDMHQDFIERNKKNISQYRADKNASCSSSGNAIAYPTPSNFELGSMGGYFTMEEVYAEFNDMHALYPNLITALEPISDFQTFEGRNIYLARVSDNPEVNEDEPEILYTAIHHAREPESISQLIFYVWYLLENYDTNPEVQTILNNTELYIVPLVNPDGYHYNQVTNPDGGGFWRKNRRDNGDGTFGVDPNRNYGIAWGTTGISFNGNSDVYCGTAPFSEPENQAMKWLCENHDFRMALNNHTYGDLLLFPFGSDYDQPTPDNDYYEIIAHHMVSQNGFTDEISSTLYPASGDSDDWMYTPTAEKPKIFAFTPEIGNSFWPVSADIIPIAKEMVFLNLTAAHLVTDYALVKDESPHTINTLTPNAAFSLQSLGLDLTNEFSVSLAAVSSNISSIGTSVSYSNMINMTIENGSIAYALDANIAVGDLVEYKLVVDQGGYTTEVFVSKVYGESVVAFTDDANNMNNWTSSGWGITTAEFYTAPSSFTDSPNGDYNNNQNKTMTLNSSVNLTDAVSANITFYAKWAIENDYDYVQLLVNNEPQCGIYTNMGTEDQDEDQPLWDGEQSDWVEEFIDLSDYLGQEVTIKFLFISDQGVTDDGFYFDEFKVNTTGAVGISELEELSNTVSCYPNPAKDQVTFLVNSNQFSNQSKIMITNEVGQELRTISLEKSTFVLDTSSLSDGIYYYFYQDGDKKSATKKLVVAH